MFSWHIDRPEIEINYTQRFPHIYTALIKSFFPFFHASNNVTQQYGSFLFSRTAFSNGSLIQVTRTSSIVTLIKQRKKSYLWLIHILIIIFSSPFLFRYVAVSWSSFNLCENYLSCLVLLTYKTFENNPNSKFILKTKQPFYQTLHAYLCIHQLFAWKYNLNTLW